jgi:site-specific DNA-methyltransferase (adenine-specific)
MTPYYDEDGVTIYHGDCREVLPTLGVSVNTTVTSPPYNQLGRMGDHGGMHGGLKWVTENERTRYSDDLTEDEYRYLHVAISADILRATVPGGSMFYNHKIRYRAGEPLHPIDLVRQFDGWRLRQEIIWDRGGSLVLNARMFPPSDERIYWMVNGDTHHWNQEAIAFMSIWRMSPAADVNGHPCPFPVALPNRAIVATTNPGDVVLDPFMGSGTTLRAAKDLNRRAVGIECEERFCEIAVSRLAQGVLDFSTNP